jgi:hypothetical protein
VAGGNNAGNGLNQLNNPWGIYVDVNLTVYIVDRGNHRVVKWAKGEIKMRIYLRNDDGDVCVDAIKGEKIAGETSVAGSWAYQFNSPTSITFDQFGNMYVLDSGNNRIQRWWPGSSYGVTVASGVLSNPRGMVFDTFGNLIVADYSNHRIVSFAAVCSKFKSLFMIFS